MSKREMGSRMDEDESEDDSDIDGPFIVNGILIEDPLNADTPRCKFEGCSNESVKSPHCEIPTRTRCTS